MYTPFLFKLFYSPNEEEELIVLSSDKNVEMIAGFVEESKKWATQRKELTKADIAHKLTETFTVLALITVSTFLITLVLVCFSFAAVYFLSIYLGSLALSFLCISCFYVIVLWIVYLKRKSWIEAPLKAFFLSIFSMQQEADMVAMRNDINVTETKLADQWDEMFHKEEEEVVLSPTKRILSILSNSAVIIDSALLGWKLYRKFNGGSSRRRRR